MLKSGFLEISTITSNKSSYFAASKFALPHLRKTKGNIINMSSLVGQLGQAGATTYVATKGGISAFTRVSIKCTNLDNQNESNKNKIGFGH